jgi:hypothetical protein
MAAWVGVVVGVGAADGPPDGKLDGDRLGALDGDLLGDLDGDPLGDLDGDGADRVLSRRQDFTDADVSSGVLSVDRGGRVGFSSIGASDKEVSRLTARRDLGFWKASARKSAIR